MNTLDNSGDEEVNPPDSQENNQQLTIRAYDSEEDDGKRTETIRPSTMLPQNIRADGSNEMVL
jgi:hypothetical protein